MLDELRRLDWFPRSLRQRVRVLDEAMRKVEHEQGRQATEEELQDITGLELRDVRQGLEACRTSSGSPWTPYRTPWPATVRKAAANPTAIRPCGNLWNAWPR